jgi:hypothetical protein
MDFSVANLFTSKATASGMYLSLSRSNVTSAILGTLESISHLGGRLRVAKRFNRSLEFSFGYVVGCSHDYRYVSYRKVHLAPVLFS